MFMLQQAAKPLKRFPAAVRLNFRATKTAAAEHQRVIQAVDADDDAKLLKVLWSCGKQSKYPYVWLRDNAQTPSTVRLDPNFQARSLLLKELDLQVKPYSLKTASDGASVQIRWGQHEDHINYPSNWLYSRDFACEKRRTNRAKECHINIPTKTWDREEIEKQTKVNFQQFLNDESYMCRQLEKFAELGIMHITNVSTDPQETRKLEDHFGYLHNTHAGATFHLKTYIDPSSIGYTNQELGMHTDFPSLAIPPPILMLHCVRRAGIGGASHLCDGFHVAELLRMEKPEVFERLTRPVMEYVDCGQEGQAWHNVQQRPLIELDGKGENVKAIYFSNHTRSWFYDLTAEETIQHFEDLKTFHDYIYDPKNLYKLPLKSGEMIWLDNRRVLHGRAAFETGQLGRAGERHVVGCYVGWDQIHSKIRVIKDKLNVLGQASL